VIVELIDVFPTTNEHISRARAPAISCSDDKCCRIYSIRSFCVINWQRNNNIVDKLSYARGTRLDSTLRGGVASGKPVM
jgi:hypothetical protein